MYVIHKMIKSWYLLLPKRGLDEDWLKISKGLSKEELRLLVD
jgi:hypothetical protein